jgi:hypothetical protein
MLHYGLYAMKINCDFCVSSWYKPRNPTSKGFIKVEKQMWYFSLRIIDTMTLETIHVSISCMSHVCARRCNVGIKESPPSYLVQGH